MKLPLSFLALGAMVTLPATASAESTADMSVGFDVRSEAGHRAGRGADELPPYLQCVPFAREVSGIQIYGDALSWWDQAEGRYQRGNRPQVGAVMAFEPYRNMALGHVAAVSKIIDRRTILVSHSNWSPINGRRGQIERDVMAVDVSPDNDWSMVRVWYDPLKAVGATAWPVHGFIYGDKAKSGAKPILAAAKVDPIRQTVAVSHRSSRAFSAAFSDIAGPAKAAAPKAKDLPKPVRIAQVAPRPASIRPDPVRDAIARYEN